VIDMTDEEIDRYRKNIDDPLYPSAETERHRGNLEDAAYMDGALGFIESVLMKGLAAGLEIPSRGDAEKITECNEKRCSMCGVIKPAGDFYPRYDGGLLSYCKPCQKRKVYERRKKIIGLKDLREINIREVG
jgi:hypothetical protein